jgi:hypothetical protein
VPGESHIDDFTALLPGPRNIRLDEAAEIINVINLPDDIVAFLQAQQLIQPVKTRACPRARMSTFLFCFTALRQSKPANTSYLLSL